MKCSRVGCKNNLTPPLKGPVKYCKDPQCVKERSRERSRLQVKRHGKRPGPPFICAGCGKLCQSPDGRKRKYCQAPECQQKRVSDNNVAAREKKKRANPIIRKRSEEPDCDARMKNFDRGTQEGFRKYMESNPVYFKAIFPRQTIAEAWRAVNASGVRR
uniref:Uncharacterized protein n=1 Tax=viral metagenome TaxID=1070528 RepID=A0A6M3XK86_9ZZZZ